MKNSITVKGLAGHLNFIMDEKVSFTTLISDLRERLQVIEQKKFRDVPCVVWLGSRVLKEAERLEMMDTFQRYGISDFKSIN